MWLWERSNQPFSSAELSGSCGFSLYYLRGLLHPKISTGAFPARNFCFLRHPGQLKALVFQPGDSLMAKKSKRRSWTAADVRELKISRAEKDASAEALPKL